MCRTPARLQNPLSLNRFGEAPLPIGPLDGPFAANIETNPAELQPNGNGAKAQDETIGNRRRQEALRRPLIAGTIEFPGHA
jgi:hypothetical protein